MILNTVVDIWLNAMFHSAESWLSAMLHCAESWLRAMLHSSESRLTAESKFATLTSFMNSKQNSKIFEGVNQGAYTLWKGACKNFYFRFIITGGYITNFLNFSNNIWISFEENFLACPFFTVKGSWFMKKTRGQKSRETVSLNIGFLIMQIFFLRLRTCFRPELPPPHLVQMFSLSSDWRKNLKSQYKNYPFSC
jgi:hypothetical protein